MKKSAAEAHRILSNTYGKAAISEKTCREWLQRFKNGDFDVEDRHSGGREVFEDAELESLLDQDSCQKQEELGVLGSENWDLLGVTQQTISKRLKVMGMIQNQGNWIPYELKPRDVERRLFACEQLLERQRRKGTKKGVHYDNAKRRAKPNNHGPKVMLCISIDKVILQHDNARPHVAKVIKTYLETLKWEVLPHPPYSPDVAPSDYHLFRSIAYGLADQHFRSYEEVKNWIDSWIASKDDQFFRRGIRTLPERWEKVVASDGQYFES
ncbi:MOS1T transposase, partial [Pseudoatta argentina]